MDAVHLKQIAPLFLIAWGRELDFLGGGIG